MIKQCKVLIFGLAVAASSALAGEFSLTSQTIHEGAMLTNEQVFNGFGCSGENISPDLKWTSGPSGTKSYALTVYDPDAPTGSGWWHWIAYNIPANVTEFSKNAGTEDGALLPAGVVQGRSDFGSYSFGGACPPEGDNAHRYIFTVHALKTEHIELPKDASAALIGFMINANSLGKATLVATYGR
ncbi:YbhB/YbcL family Raf kinase inhibitor-like protein [Aestuariicella hydrocarbonica]|uniref:YbhB/YbcL family Raf kinase inhibitor-like protein n=2 Tax=Pseudomaricurvus hydrocarbonicus TaxID=1470433 RepID=A0A9E5JWC4_9GAMM|nr:YbhB/YbcL family Raf kinase inhibitor-like protein [Aestuariicella hydrocarbonica]